MSKEKIVITIIVLIIMAPVVIWIMSENHIADHFKKTDEGGTYYAPSRTTNDNTRKNSSNYNLSAYDVKSEVDNYWYYVKGFVRNDSSRDYEEILIQYNALDADGYKLSTCSDVIYNLKSGESAPFKATCVTDKEKVADYKLNFIMPGKNVD
jgi:uncharacterized protein YxeA